MLGRLFNKISGAGLILLLIGTVLLGFSLRDTMISFKTAKSFDFLTDKDSEHKGGA